MDKILFFIWAPGVTSRIIATVAQGSTVSHLKVLTNFEWYMQYLIKSVAALILYVRGHSQTMWTR